MFCVLCHAVRNDTERGGFDSGDVWKLGIAAGAIRVFLERGFLESNFMDEIVTQIIVRLKNTNDSERITHGLYTTVHAALQDQDLQDWQTFAARPARYESAAREILADKLANDVVISSSKSGQKSGARSTTDQDLTVFGAQLIAALEGGAPGESPGIGILDLFAYLSGHVPVDAKKLNYQGQPLAQNPLLYANQVDQNFAIALRPNTHGGTLDADIAALIAELAEIEVQLAEYDDESNAPVQLVERRDTILQKLEIANEVG